MGIGTQIVCEALNPWLVGRTLTKVWLQIGQVGHPQLDGSLVVIRITDAIIVQSILLGQIILNLTGVRMIGHLSLSLIGTMIEHLNLTGGDASVE